MDMLVRGRHVITDPAVGEPGVLEDGAVLVSGSRIAAVGAWTALRRRHPRARVVGNGRQLLMPGLVEAHSHGRALSPNYRPAAPSSLNACGVLAEHLDRLEPLLVVREHRVGHLSRRPG